MTRCKLQLVRSIRAIFYSQTTPSATLPVCHLLFPPISLHQCTSSPVTTRHPVTCLLQPYHRLTQSATPRNSTWDQPAQLVGTNGTFLQPPCHAQPKLSLFLHHPSASDHSPSNYTGNPEDRLVSVGLAFFTACIFCTCFPGIAAACGLHTAST